MPISTGTQLDRKLADGFPNGSVTTITAPWASNVERFIHQLIEKNDQQCFYVSTEQTKPVIKKVFDNSNLLKSSQPTIIELNDNSRPIQLVRNKIESVPDGSFVIIDSINALESQGRQDYRALLNQIREEISDTDTSVILFGSFGDQKPPNRRITYRLSDAVMEFRIQKQSGDIETFIDIPKFRGIKEIDERVKIILGDSEITIDTSRAVA